MRLEENEAPGITSVCRSERQGGREISCPYTTKPGTALAEYDMHKRSYLTSKQTMYMRARG